MLVACQPPSGLVDEPVAEIVQCTEPIPLRIGPSEGETYRCGLTVRVLSAFSSSRSLTGHFEHRTLAARHGRVATCIENDVPFPQAIERERTSHYV
jgi:hypothetical protein